MLVHGQTRMYANRNGCAYGQWFKCTPRPSTNTNLHVFVEQVRLESFARDTLETMGRSGGMGMRLV